jgi:nucleoside-triphosphatase THEP1
MSWKTELYIARLRMPKELRYSKSLSLEDIKDFLEIRPYGKSYGDYIKLGLLYFTKVLGILARELGVDRVRPKGLYIMGIYGGEKRCEEKYAGLVLEEYSVDKAVFEFKLYNTRDVLIVPQDLLEKYDVKIYRMIYRGEINPFRLRRYLNIILSRSGDEKLKGFLREALDLNFREISADTAKKISALINELRQPSEITTLKTGKYYVAYRGKRSFTALAFKPIEDNVIVKDEVGYIECESEGIAYYYAAILNYLAYKVVALERTFIRDQYGRPPLAIYVAGLSWKNVSEETRGRVMELSKRLHEKALDKDYSDQKAALRDIAQYHEFKELVSLLDSEVDKERLEEALELVSGVGESSQQGLDESLESYTNRFNDGCMRKA